MKKAGRKRSFDYEQALGMRATGLTSAEIAERLHTTVSSVKKFFSRLIKKGLLERIR